MAIDVASLPTRPRPADKKLRQSFFGLFGAPIAWYVQLCAGVPLASESCYPGTERRLALPAHFGWTRGAIAALMIAACIVSLAALSSSWAAYRRSSEEMLRSPAEAARIGADRACFLALWGIVFGAGFAVASVITFLAYFVLPRCAG